MPPVIDLSRLQEIKKKLKELPKVERVKTFSGPEALEALQKDIRALSRKGYDSKEITKILKQEGLAVSSAKVKKILVNETPENMGPPDLAPAPLFGGDDSADNAPAPASSSPSVVRRPAKPKTNGKEAQQ